MKRMMVSAGLTLAAVLVWLGATFLAFSEGWLRQPLTSKVDAADFVAAAEKEVATGGTGNLVMLVLEDGVVTERLSWSSGEPVGPDTRFQVASLSKWLSAWGVMALVQDGALDLDAPVSQYLTRWQLPDGPFDEQQVTVRRLLSHTAGLGDGLGYQGFETADAVQSLEDSLTRARDASPGAAGEVRVVAEPGVEWDYSGGGYTLLQLLIEEVSGQSFTSFMQQRVFLPLGMTDTTYDFDEAMTGPVAENYAADGATEPLRRYTSLAATALFTDASDLARFAAAQAPSAAESPVLTKDTLAQMRRPHAAQFGVDVWGLGVMLYAPHGQGDFIIGHDGDNEPAINTAVRLSPADGDAIVVLTTGMPLTATRLASEWVFWKTGRVDNLLFILQTGSMLRTMVIGALVIALLGAVLGWRYSRRQRLP